MEITSQHISTDEVKRIVDLLPGYVCVKDLNGALVYCNKALADNLKLYSPMEAIGNSGYDLLRSEDAKIIEENDRYVMQNNVKKDFLEVAHDSNGNMKTYYSRKSPYHDQDGNVIGLLCVAIDIDELTSKITRLEEEKKDKSNYINKMHYLEKLAPWFPGYLYWKDLTGVYLGCNENQRKVFADDFDGSLVGKTLYQVLPYEVAKVVDDVDNEIMRTGKGKVLQESMKDVRGKDYIVMSSKMPVHDDEGNIIGLLGVSLDITERIRMEESLKRAKSVADAANNAKSDFIMNMSHDLRTPFVSIIGFCNVLQQNEPNESNKAMLTHILNAATQLLKIIDELIEVASSDEQMANVHERINFRMIVEELVNLMNPRIEFKKIALYVEIDENIPRYVVGNKFALNRIILNLLGNAVKFTEKGHVKLNCTALTPVKNNQIVLRLSVEDTGIGIPSSQVEKIFTKFHRATGAEGRFEGTGLGLYFVKLMVEQMSGSITVDSEYKNGAKFDCDLPFNINP